MAASKYNEALLGPLVAASSSVTEVIRKLGLSPTGGNFRNISGRIRYLQLDTSHFWGNVATRINALTREELVPLVTASKSVAQVAISLGIPEHGRAHRNLTTRLSTLSLDTSHFRGSGWSRGETRNTHPSVEQASRKLELPDSELFCENARPTNGPRLTKRLLAMGVRYECELCGINEWRGARLVLHLDHINGINNDNRRENLRLLCPNCHSQTETYGNRASRASQASEPSHVLYESGSRAWRNWLTQRL